MPNITGDVLPGSSPIYDFSPNFTAPSTAHFAEGGSTSEGHNPQFYSEGGLQNRYVSGDGDGTSDSIPAMLANGEFVIPADVVASLGNGSNNAGANIMDEFLTMIRMDKQHHPEELPPDSKGPLAYMELAIKKAKK